MQKLSKSQKYIIDTFLKLRKKQSIEKMTVTHLCKEADINKSTFYVYYHDLYDLSEFLENRIVEEITESLEHPENIIKDPTLFTRELFKAFEDKSDIIKTIFSDNRSSLLPHKILTSLKELLFELHPEYKNSNEISIILSYYIYGAYYALIENQTMDRGYTVSVISSLVKWKAGI